MFQIHLTYCALKWLILPILRFSFALASVLLQLIPLVVQYVFLAAGEARAALRVTFTLVEAFTHSDRLSVHWGSLMFLMVPDCSIWSVLVPYCSLWSLRIP